jgi:hypothetical protein
MYRDVCLGLLPSDLVGWPSSGLDLSARRDFRPGLPSAFSGSSVAKLPELDWPTAATLRRGAFRNTLDVGK